MPCYPLQALIGAFYVKFIILLKGVFYLNYENSDLKNIVNDIEDLMLKYKIKAIGFVNLGSKIDVQVLGDDGFSRDIFREGTSL